MKNTTALFEVQLTTVSKQRETEEKTRENAFETANHKRALSYDSNLSSLEIGFF